MGKHDLPTFIAPRKKFTKSAARAIALRGKPCELALLAEKRTNPAAGIAKNRETPPALAVLA